MRYHSNYIVAINCSLCSVVLFGGDRFPQNDIHLCAFSFYIVTVPPQLCIWDNAQLCPSMLCTVLQMAWQQPPWSHSLFTSLCQPLDSSRFLHSHPLWIAVIIAKLYAHMAASQPLKPHCNITQ